MRLIPSLALLMVAGLSACDRAGEEQPAGILNQAAQNDAAPASSAIEQVAFDRLGLIRLGATIADLEAEGLVVAGRDDVLPGTTCAYASFRGLEDVAVMLDGERIVRIDVSGSQHEGPYGLRVGQSEAEAIRRLGSAKVQDHPYTGPQGHYLILLNEEAGTGLIAETDGETVERWRIGQHEQVQWIEGCA